MTRSFVLGAMLTLAPIAALAQPGGASVTTTSKEASALYEKAVDHLQNVEIEKARPLLDQAILADPEFAMAHLMRAQAGGGPNVGREHREKAVSLADKVSPAERHWIMAVQAQANADVPGMKQHLAELLTLRPNDPQAATFAGNLYRGMGDDKKSLEMFERATTLDPTFAAAYNQAGYAHIRLGNMAGAEASLKKYIANRPASANPYDSYAELLLFQGRYDESIAQYTKALEKDPAFSGSFTGIGHNYTFKGDYAKARESYKRLYDLGSPANKSNALFWTAVSYVHEGRTDEALKSLAEQRDVAMTAGFAPAAANAHLDRAFILSESGKAADAAQEIAAAATIIESAQLTEGARANWHRQLAVASAATAAQGKDAATAKTHLEKVKTQMTPGLPAAASEQYEVAMGVNEFYQGNYDAALRHFEKADHEDTYAMFYAAEAMRLKGDTAGAAAKYKKVAASNQNNLAYALVRARAKKSGT